MANKINVRLILELHDHGMSQDDIARTRHMSRSSVSTVVRIAKTKGITSASIADKTDEDIYRLFFPEKLSAKDIYELPDYDYVHNELKKVGVTLTLLWKEYCDKCHAEGKIAVGRTKFCEDYNKYCSAKALTNHLEHKPGERCEVDWSGPTMKIVKEATGEAITVYLLFIFLLRVFHTAVMLM